MIDLTLQLDWKPNSQFAGILWAHANGWYANAGINLKIRPWRPHYNQMDALEEEGNVIVSTEDNLLIQACAAGKPVKAIGTMVQFSGIGWMTLREANIRHIRDLRGKRIGVHPDGITALRAVLQQQHITLDEVEVVDVNYDYGPLLRSGQFDAMQCYVIVEPFELARQGFDLHTLIAHEWGYQAYSQVLATTQRLIDEQPGMLIGFLKASFDGWRAALSQPVEAVAYVRQALPDCDVDSERASLEAMRAFMVGDVGWDRIGWMSAERWQKSIDYLAEQKLLPQAVTPDAVMTTTLMEAVYRL